MKKIMMILCLAVLTMFLVSCEGQAVRRTDTTREKAPTIGEQFPEKDFTPYEEQTVLLEIAMLREKVTEQNALIVSLQANKPMPVTPTISGDYIGEWVYDPTTDTGEWKSLSFAPIPETPEDKGGTIGDGVWIAGGTRWTQTRNADGSTTITLH